MFLMSITGGSNTATLTAHNAATASGGDPIVVSVNLNTTLTIDFGPTGIVFDTNLSTAQTGTGATSVITYMVD